MAWDAGCALDPVEGRRGRWTTVPDVERGRCAAHRPRRRLRPDRGCYPRPLLMALTSSPFVVSPLNSQKNAPPRLWFFAQLILLPMVAGVS